MIKNNGLIRKVGKKKMTCKTCGRQIANEEANFCEYCGASLKQTDDPFEPNSQKREEQTPILFGEREGTKQSWFKTDGSGKEPIITFGQWLLIMLVLPLIPAVGPLIYLVVLFILAFGKNTPTTLKNWARATLVMLCIGFVLLYFMAGQMMQILSGI